MRYSGEKKYFTNARGGRVYHDPSKHDVLPIVEDKHSLYTVLSLGSYAGDINEMTITIRERGKPVVYLLPHSLHGWATHCIILAHTEVNLFPSKVQFGVIEGRTYAEIL